MLGWVQRDERIDRLEQQLGPGWRERLADPAWASGNTHAQCLLTALSLAAYRQVAAVLGPPAIVAGYSVGELAAFAAAGVLDDAHAQQLAEQRATCMNRAAATGPATALMGVAARTPAGLETLCAHFDLDLAIRIGPANAVLGGPLAALDAAARHAEAAGLRITRLNVALASHTRWMRPAQPLFAAALDAVPLRRPVLALASNALGRIQSAEQGRHALVQQLAQTVGWDTCLDSVADQRVDVVLEIGPGQALARMWNEREPQVPARSADEFRSLEALLGWVRRQADHT